ncbi:MAG: hypothetical protein H8F28_13390, partial [Fibrella sp.]|nr:hypothetical protein [Armatimonadota bacterium]
MVEVFSGVGNRPVVDVSAPDVVACGLEICLFGPMEVRVGGRSLPRLRSRKGLWLLALLALRAGRDVDRDWLAGTLWSEHREDAARRSLRQSLHDLRAALGADAARVSCESPRSLRLDLAPGSGTWADILSFDAATNRIATATPAALEAAVALYRGPLLQDCAEEWALEERRERETRYIAALERLAELAGARGDHRTAADYLQRALDGDPLREDLLRAQMTVLAASGSISAAREA